MPTIPKSTGTSPKAFPDVSAKRGRAYKSSAPDFDRVIATFAPKKAERLAVGEIGGILRCTYHGERWCDHIEKVIREGRDAHPEGMSSQQALDSMPEAIVVPIVPTHHFYATARLSPTDADGFRAAHLIGATAYKDPRPGVDPFRSAADKEDEYPLLGFVGAGDGRMVLRAMVVEYLRPLYRLVPSCRSKVHKSIHWSRSDLRAAPIAAEDWASIFLLHRVGKCQPCMEFSTDFSSDAPSL